MKLFNRTMFFIVSLLFAMPTLSQQGIGAKTFFQPTQDDMKMLQEMEKEINKIVSGMKKEEREQFNRDVEELTKVMEKMKPEELESFVNEVFTQPPAPMPLPVPKKEVAKRPVKKKKPAPKKEKVPVKKQDQALQIIDVIIKRTNNFLVKAQVIPDAENKINEWGKEDKKIQNWQPDLDWDELKLQIEAFVQKLHKMKEKDPKTKEYKHIAAFIKDEALYNNMAKLKTTLAIQEPKVEIPPFGLEELSPESETAMLVVLNAYTEGFYLLNIPKGLATVMAQYEERAKELREEEEAAQKRAFEEAKIPELPAPTVLAGTPEAEDYYAPTYRRAPSYAPTYRPTYAPTRRPARPAARRAPTRQTPTGKVAGRPGAKIAAKSAQAETEDKKLKDRKPGVKKPTVEVAKKIEDPALKRPIKKVDHFIDAAAQVLEDLEDHPILKDILKDMKKHMEDATQEVDTRFAKALQSMTSNLKRATNNVEQLQEKVKNKKLSKPLQKRIKDEIKAIFDVNKDLFNKVIKQTKKIRDLPQEEIKKIPAKKRYAYLGEKEAVQKEDAETLKFLKELPEPGSIYLLEDALNDLKKAIDKLPPKTKKRRLPHMR